MVYRQYLYLKSIWQIFGVFGNGTRDTGFAVYAGETLAGVLMVEIKGKCKKYPSVWRSLYAKFLDAMHHLVAGKGVDKFAAE